MSRNFDLDDVMLGHIMTSLLEIIMLLGAQHAILGIPGGARNMTLLDS